jgi:hypothetical protein
METPVRRSRLLQIIHCQANDLREQNPDSVRQEDADASHHVTTPVFLEIGKQRAETLGQHAFLDAILSVRASVLGALQEALQGAAGLGNLRQAGIGIFKVAQELLVGINRIRFLARSIIRRSTWKVVLADRTFALLSMFGVLCSIHVDGNSAYHSKNFLLFAWFGFFPVLCSMDGFLRQPCPFRLVPQVRAPVLGANLGGGIFSRLPRMPPVHDLEPSIPIRSPQSQSPAAHSADSCSTSTPLD